MQMSPTTHTTTILVFSNPSAGVFANSMALYRITGGIASVMAQQQNPPTYPNTVPKLGTTHAKPAADDTNAARVTSDVGKLGSFPPATNCSQMFRHERAMSGNVNSKLTQSKALTAVPAAPSSIVITTDFTPGPNPHAPITPNKALTIIDKPNAFETAGTNRLRSGMASWTPNSVKWMKNKNATVPKNPENAAGLDIGIAAAF
mmetsp:Transcript_14007/g.58973  ORF Transcript_14007/g.58973 Transcript_14007/m.58973 type:complete len:203 (+) Transcript_14007:1290-1898(+)